jgi:hypothetical protein
MAVFENTFEISTRSCEPDYRQNSPLHIVPARFEYSQLSVV